MSKSPKPAGLAEFSLLPGLLPDPFGGRSETPATSDPDPLSEASAPAGAAGHRLRMRQRLLRSGPDALADHEMLEMILFIALPRRDTKPLARALLARFRSFGAVVGAPVTELMAVDGIGEAGAAALKLIQAAALRMLQKTLATQPVLSTWDRLIDYLTAAMQHERTEHFRILFLDGRNRVIADEVQGYGTINHAPAYPREVIRRCLELHATAVILAHNHPSGEPAPSRDDIALTAEIAKAASMMGITLHDHIIVGKGKCLSFRSERLL